MAEQEVAVDLNRCLSTICSGLTFYLQETLNPEKATPLGDQVEPEVAQMIDSFIAEDEAGARELIRAIRAEGDFPSAERKYDFSIFHFNFLRSEHLLQVLQEGLTKDLARLESSIAPLKDHRRYGPTVNRLAEKKRQQVVRISEWSQRGNVDSVPEQAEEVAEKG